MNTNSKYDILFLSLFIATIGYSIYNQPAVLKDRPVPVEFADKKKKKKEFKKNRKEFFEYIHQAAPDIDWRKMDRITREDRIERIKLIRSQDGFDRNNLNRVTVSSRNLDGEWFERGSNNLAGRIRTADIDFQNGLIYCMSSGGNIWRGNLEGSDWQSLNDYHQISGVILLRKIENRIIIANDKGVYYSDNEGLTLNQSSGLEFLDDWGNIKRVVIKYGENEVYALIKESIGGFGAVTSIYKSEDLGESFFRVFSFNSDYGFNQQEDISHFDIWTYRYDYSYIYIMNDNNLFRLNSNDTIEWLSSINVIYSGDVLLTGGMGINSHFLYAHIDGRIYQSINGGSSWAPRGFSPSDWYFTINSFNSSNINEDHIYIGGIEAFRSLDGGQNWDTINNWWDYYDNPESKLHADIPEIRFFLDEEYNEVALISTDGGIYLSEDGILNVDNLSLFGLGVSQYYSTYTKRQDPYHIYAGSQDQGFQRSLEDNEGIRLFEQSISGDYGHLVSGDQGETIWCNYPGFTMYYPNPETDINGITLDFPGSGHLWLAPLAVDPTNPQVAYLGGGGVNDGNHIIKLSVQGNSLSYEELPSLFSGVVSAIAISPIDYSHWYILTDNGKFYHSDDSGQNWVNNQWFSGPSSHYFYGSAIVPSSTNLGEVYIGGSGYSNPGVYKTINHGQNFTSLEQGLPNTMIYDLDISQDESLLFAATEVGPYVYVETDNQWYDLSGVSAPDQTYWSVEYIHNINTARYGTYGRGIWDFVIGQEFNIISGDLNNDTLINIQDIILLVNIILGISESSDYQNAAGDLSGDNQLDVIDIVAIINIILDR